MQASSVSVVQRPYSKPLYRISTLATLLLAGAALVGVAPPARADDGQVILATGLGAVAGALIGQSFGGRNATIVGGALGAAVGASAATQSGYQRNRATLNYSNGTYQGGPSATVVYTQPVRVYRTTPTYQPIYQPAYQPVYQAVYEPVYRPVLVRPVVYPIAVYGGTSQNYENQYDSDDRRHQGRGRGWDNDYSDRGDRDDRGGRRR